MNALSPTLRILALLFLSFTTSAGAPAELTGRVVGVHDGDTLTLLEPGNRQTKIRLNQIDAPELGQDFGKASKQSLSGLVFGKPVRVEVVDTDKYQRTIGNVWVGATDVNLAQIRQGMAWAYRKYLHDLAYLEAETAARNARRGLWSRSDAMPPWEYRHPARRAAAVLPLISSPTSRPVKEKSSASCGTKRFCKEMTSCAEAGYYLQICGVTDLDRDGDGVACESLCR